MMNFALQTRNFVFKTRNCVSKSRNFVLNMMNLQVEFPLRLFADVEFGDFGRLCVFYTENHDFMRF